MKNETSIQWLYNNLKSHFEHDGDLFEVVQMSFDIAKQMEKKQISDAYDWGLIDGAKNEEEGYYNGKNLSEYLF